MLKQKVGFKILLLFVFLYPISLFAFDGDAGIINPAPNPSAAYCEDLGYEFIIKDTPEGQLGVCKISDTIEAPAWDFLKGKEAVEYNYCSKMGYEMKISSDPEKCNTSFSYECAVCILPDGQEVEAVNLMKLEKENKIKPNNIAPVLPLATTQANNVLTAKNIVLLFLALVIIATMIAAYFYFIKSKKEQ